MQHPEQPSRPLLSNSSACISLVSPVSLASPLSIFRTLWCVSTCCSAACPCAAFLHVLQVGNAQHSQKTEQDVDFMIRVTSILYVNTRLARYSHRIDGVLQVHVLCCILFHEKQSPPVQGVVSLASVFHAPSMPTTFAASRPDMLRDRGHHGQIIWLHG